MYSRCQRASSSLAHSSAASVLRARAKVSPAGWALWKARLSNLSWQEIPGQLNYAYRCLSTASSVHSARRRYHCSAAPVLCVDLDGTLIRGDILWESILALICLRPWFLLYLLFWLRRGRAHLKRRLAELAPPEPETLPYRDEVLRYVRSARARGRRVILATATHQLAAQRIACHLDLFDEVLATSADRNLSGENKLAALRERCGDGFDYIGDSRKDLPIFKAARRSVLVDPSPGLLRRATTVGNVESVLSERRDFIRTALSSMRVHQWTKNLLLGTALVAGHRFGNASAYGRLAAAFLSFSFAASAVYLINDLLDIQSDRKHQAKRLRPLASGRLAIPTGAALAAVCLAFSIALSVLTLPVSFRFWLGVYLFVTMCYSLDLKRRLLLDVISLAGLYTIRILAGGAAVNVVVSRWLLAFSMFIFMSLALAKRYVEAAAAPDSSTKLAGRGYWPSDADLIRVVGPANGVTVLVLALYINGPDVQPFYRRPDALWLLCPLRTAGSFSMIRCFLP